MMNAEQMQAEIYRLEHLVEKHYHGMLQALREAAEAQCKATRCECDTTRDGRVDRYRRTALTQLARYLPELEDLIYDALHPKEAKAK